MTNFEKNKDIILEMINQQPFDFAVSKDSNKIMFCCDAGQDDCNNCLFKNEDVPCHICFIKWLCEDCLYNGKIACISTENEKVYKKGKIYEVKDGILYSEQGAVTGVKFVKFDDIGRNTSAEWLEIVEG